MREQQRRNLLEDVVERAHDSIFVPRSAIPALDLMIQNAPNPHKRQVAILDGTITSRINHNGGSSGKVQFLNKRKSLPNAASETVDITVNGTGFSYSYGDQFIEEELDPALFDAKGNLVSYDHLLLAHDLTKKHVRSTSGVFFTRMFHSNDSHYVPVQGVNYCFPHAQATDFAFGFFSEGDLVLFNDRGSPRDDEGKLARAQERIEHVNAQTQFEGQRAKTISKESLDYFLDTFSNGDIPVGRRSRILLTQGSYATAANYAGSVEFQVMDADLKGMWRSFKVGQPYEEARVVIRGRMAAFENGEGKRVGYKTLDSPGLIVDSSKDEIEVDEFIALKHLNNPNHPIITYQGMSYRVNKRELREMWKDTSVHALLVQGNKEGATAYLLRKSNQRTFKIEIPMYSILPTT